MMGYAPAWKDVLVFTSRLDEDGFRVNTDGDIEVFGPREWNEVPQSARQCGTLIDASRYPDHFKEVMTNWLERNGNARRKSANTRFFGSMQGASARVIEDSIVSAANTFDLLPDEDKPEARRRVKRRLRDIVEHRAKVVLDHYGADTLQQLKDVIRLAVMCRNYYTHGPRHRDAGDVDFADPKVVFFLAKTLEFIYGASELRLCGWDSHKSVTYDWHPLGGYVTSYDAKRSMVLGLQ